jgi:hypothetical protein
VEVYGERDADRVRLLALEVADSAETFSWTVVVIQLDVFGLHELTFCRSAGDAVAPRPIFRR